MKSCSFVRPLYGSALRNFCEYGVGGGAQVALPASLLPQSSTNFVCKKNED